MERPSYSSDPDALLSHPDKLLSDHVLAVSKLARRFAGECECPLTKGDAFPQIAELVGLAHDLGKATPYFQEYIRAETDPRRKKELRVDKKQRHGLISAIMGYWLAEEQLSKLSLEQDQRHILHYAIFLAIKHHHGNLDDPLNSVILDKMSVGVLLDQWKSIDHEAFRELLSSIGIGSAYEIIKDGFALLDTGSLSRDRMRRLLRRISTCQYYYLTNLLYSTLIDADKTDAGIGGLPDRGKLDSYIVDKYRREKGWERPQRHIDVIRNRVYLESNSRVENLDLKCRILSMNVPTGLGKTLAAFNCALKLREKVEVAKGYTPRIIYALPFLSIIEQNFETISDVLGEDVDSSILLKHHHLSDVFYKEDDADEYTMSQSQLLMEAWNSEIIVTTFVQLFHTLVGYRNRSLKKLHRIANSIIILDEIQALPHKYWLLLRDVMKYLSDNINIYFIIVTATKPLIFSEQETYDLIQEPERYFSAVDRIQLEVNTGVKLELGEFQEMILSDIESQPEKRFLIVMNTIRSAVAIYNSLNAVFDRVSYLSTHIIPKHRIERIVRARNTEDIRIMVSTQLIEAGVDIDFDVVYRDFAPLDSINQAAGRCNRNMEASNKGSVKVVRLTDGSRTYASYIYDSLLLSKTDTSILPETILREAEFIMRNNEYYSLVNSAMSNETSRKILGSAFKLNYDGSDSSVSTFRLIEESAGYEKVDIFVEVDDCAEGVWRKYSELQREKDWKKRHEAFLKIKARFYQYVISVSRKYAESNCPPLVNGIHYIARDQIPEYYSEKTGFIISGGASRIW